MFKIFDSHFHVIDYDFPLLKNNSYFPPEYTFEDYLKRVENLNVKGGVVVSGSFQGFDQSYLTQALKKLGTNFVGVTQLPATVTDEEIISLNEAGIRAVRFNLKRGGSETIDVLESFGRRVYDLAKWHVELYVDSKDLPDLTPTLLKLPYVSIDHLGLSKDGLKHLFVLASKGVKIKATGFGRVDFDVLPALKEIVKINPNSLMFGSDLPSTRAPRPFSEEDIRLITDNFEEEVVKNILYSNAHQFYCQKNI